jgi:hypothetical protein
MNQQINEDQNTIDRGVSDITSFDLLEQPDTNLNKSAFKTELDESYRIEDEAELGNYPAIENYGTFTTEGALQSAIDTKDFVKSAIPGVVSSLVTDTLGAVNVLNPLYVGEGESKDYGAENYFSSVFDGAISGKTRDGEMFISYEDARNNPNIDEWMFNTKQIMLNNATEQMTAFRGANNINNKKEYDEFKDRAFNDKEKGPEFDEFRRLISQIQNPEPFKKTEKGYIINQDMLPQMPMDVDPKFTKDGDLSLPYAGLFGYNDEGEFVMKRPSMFRFTDELTRGKENDGILSNFVEKAEDYLYPNINASFSYGDTPKETYGYMAGQVAPGIKGLINLAQYGGKQAIRGGKGIMNLIRGKSKVPFDEIDYRKEPYIASNMDQGLGGIENQMNLFNK